MPRAELAQLLPGGRDAGELCREWRERLGGGGYLHLVLYLRVLLKLRFLLKTLSTVVKGKRGRVFFCPLGAASRQVGFGSRNPS